MAVLNNITDKTIIECDVWGGTVIIRVNKKKDFITQVMRLIDNNIKMPTFRFYNSKHRFNIEETNELITIIYNLYNINHRNIYDEKIDVERLN